MGLDLSPSWGSIRDTLTAKLKTNQDKRVEPGFCWVFYWFNGCFNLLKFLTLTYQQDLMTSSQPPLYIHSCFILQSRFHCNDTMLHSVTVIFSKICHPNQLRTVFAVLNVCLDTSHTLHTGWAASVRPSIQGPKGRDKGLHIYKTVSNCSYRESVI